MMICEQDMGISENETRMSSENSEDQQKRGQSLSAVLEWLAEEKWGEQTNRL
jgi:hypothetical protein